ncbi:cell envelope integrity protein CreD [Acidovorax sp. FJL06]|uniref:cell envelope integrity protein CreD n=1 Tax=Acidovorax sp. FJL06 TaxID=2153365 RepID=UPI000F58A527|nr:cell envelope integrity protein CreD [Acidovorax sp. FJL06]RQO81726.1 cell envelope integrity protein CreD [Acidovorax sp. FJL06]
MLKHPLFIKLAALAAITVLLLFGLGLIEDVVRDRLRYRSITAQSVAESLAGPQTLMGPMIHSACVESWDEESGKGDDRRMVEKRREFILTAMPEQLKLSTGAAMEERARGLHKVNTYNLKAHVTAQWGPLTSLMPQTTMKNSRMVCGAPVVMMAVGDARGIRTAQLTLDNQALALKPGTFHPTYSRGLHAVLPESVRGKADGLTATLDLELVGTERLGIVPLGGSTEVAMTSSWPHPSFAGRFLPSEREVKKTGFSAQWRLSSLATTAQADIANGKRICLAGGDDAIGHAPGSAPGDCADSFSVAFIDPVNPYSLSDRATKYGVLFIALTFVAVGLFELMGSGPHAPPLRGSLPPEGAAFSSGGGPAMKKLRVHPVQYLLVGSALCSFFLLLVSLSEHLPFGISYAIAATACVLLLAYYASHMLGSLARGIPLGAGIALLYGLLYVLLQLEQTALAVGAIALFLVLAAVMVLTRKVNWYGLSQGGTPSRPLPPAARSAAPRTEAA